MKNILRCFLVILSGLGLVHKSVRFITIHLLSLPSHSPALINWAIYQDSSSWSNLVLFSKQLLRERKRNHLQRVNQFCTRYHNKSQSRNWQTYQVTMTSYCFSVKLVKRCGGSLVPQNGQQIGHSYANKTQSTPRVKFSKTFRYTTTCSLLSKHPCYFPPSRKVQSPRLATHKTVFSLSL